MISFAVQPIEVVLELIQKTSYWSFSIACLSLVIYF